MNLMPNKDYQKRQKIIAELKRRQNAYLAKAHVAIEAVAATYTEQNYWHGVAVHFQDIGDTQGAAKAWGKEGAASKRVHTLQDAWHKNLGRSWHYERRRLNIIDPGRMEGDSHDL